MKNSLKIILLITSIVINTVANNSSKNQEITWPSDATMGNATQQTAELIQFISDGYIIKCRSGTFELENPFRIDDHDVNIQGSTYGQTVFKFIDGLEGGMRIFNSNSIKISDIKFIHVQNPEAERSHWGAGLLIGNSTNVEVLRSSLYYAPGAGFHFSKCDGVTTKDLYVEGSLADGIHYANTSNITAYNLETKHTGDDGVAIVDYKSGPESSNFLLEKIKVYGSMARGIGLIGARNGILKDFFIDRTSTNGLQIVEDRYYETRITENVQVFSGKITRTGHYPPDRDNRYGINIHYVKNISITDVEVDNTQRYGCIIHNSTGIKLNNIRLKKTDFPPLYILNSTNVNLRDIRATGGNITPFINIVGVKNLSAVDITIVDNTLNTTTKAIIIRKSEDSATNNIHIHNLKLITSEHVNEKKFKIEINQIQNSSIDYFTRDNLSITGSASGLEVFKKHFKGI
ncbi:MAG: glycoside hydrolase family 28 protein [Flavobacteriaceae bacterium]|nr:glycoside hydrolase family 28 protein [Flavobacteriaceae bacterium]